MKTTMELPDAVFRETKALAARKGLSLRQVIIDALAEKLQAEKKIPAAKPWLQAFRDLSPKDGLAQELRRLNRRIETEFEQVQLEDWK